MFGVVVVTKNLYYQLPKTMLGRVKKVHLCK